MRRPLLPLLTLVFVAAVPAFAFRARPLSDLRFDDRPSPVAIAGAASDGRDFLLLGGSDGHVFVQRFAGGRLVARQLVIAPGSPGRIVLAGNHYLVSWSDTSGTFVAPLSAEGNVLSMPSQPVTTVQGALLAVNARSAIVAGGGQVQPLDLNGRAVGSAKPLPPVSQAETLDDAAPAGDAFALAYSGWESTLLLRLRADGTAVTATPTMIDGPYGGTASDSHSIRTVLAGSGDDALVVFETGKTYASDTDLKTAIVDANGAVKRTAHIIYSMAGPRSLDPSAGIVADGGQYLLALGISLDPTGNFTDVDPAVLRISSSGDRVGDPFYLHTGPRRQVPLAIASNGSELVVPWYDTDNQTSLGNFVVSAPLATMQADAPQRIGRTIDAQTNVAVAAMNGRYLAAWIESTQEAHTLRVSRVDAAGNYLDGTGIVLSTIGSSVNYYGPTVAIDGDGVNWFVVWADGQVRGLRLSPAGVPLDAGPIAVGYGSEATVRWNGTNYVVAFTDESLHTVPVGGDGTVGTTRTLVEARYGGGYGTTSNSFRSPSLASLGGRFLVAYEAHESACFIGTPGGCFDSSSIVALHLDPNGASLDSAPLKIGPAVSVRPAVATDGSSYLVAFFSTTDGLQGALLPGKPFPIDAKGDLPALTFDGRDFVAAWQRSSDRTIVIGRIRGGALMTAAAMRLEGSETAFSRPAIAATASMPPLAAFDSRHDAYGGVSRAGVLFASEIENEAPGVPDAPAIVSAVRLDADTVLVQWLPVAGALGVAIELRAADGTYRQIGVAAGGASSGRASLAGLTGTAIRVRAWNAAGLSLRSADVPLTSARRRSSVP